MEQNTPKQWGWDDFVLTMKLAGIAAAVLGTLWGIDYLNTR